MSFAPGWRGTNTIMQEHEQRITGGQRINLNGNVMATVKAKFMCQSVTEFQSGDKEVKFSAVYKDGTENGDYAKYTPSAELRMVINKETRAVDYFKPGGQYYLTFEAAE